MAKETIFDTPFLESLRAVKRGTAEPGQLREMVRRKVIAAMATGVTTDQLSIVLMAAQHGKHAEAQAFLEEKDRLPPNASLLQGTGAFGVDFVICGWLPKGWATTARAQAPGLFQSYYRYEATRHYRYKGHKFLETVSKASLSLADSEDALLKFLEETALEPKTRIWICDPSTVPVRTFVGFVQMGSAPNISSWIQTAQKSKVLDPIQDLFEVRWDLHDSSHGAFPEFFRSLDCMAVGQYQEVDADAGNYSYTNSLTQLNHWRNALSTRELANKVAVVELESLIESHEQYIAKTDILSRLARYGSKVDFAYAGHEEVENEACFDLPLPLWNTVILATAGTRKTALVAHVARAFLCAGGGKPYDILYVNCKNSHKHPEYGPGPAEANEVWLFDDLLYQLAKVHTTPVRACDLEAALREPPADPAVGRSFYTELLTQDSAITRLQNQVPKMADRHGRNLLIIFDELLNHASKRRDDGAPIDPTPFDYLDLIRLELRTDGQQYLVIGQELAQFYPTDERAGPQSVRLPGLIGECNVIMGYQDLNAANRAAYEHFISGRKPRTEATPVWGYDLEEVSGFSRPIGPFFLFARDSNHGSYPVPGHVVQRAASTSPGDVRFVWKQF